MDFGELPIFCVISLVPHFDDQLSKLVLGVPDIELKRFLVPRVKRVLEHLGLVCAGR